MRRLLVIALFASRLATAQPALSVDNILEKFVQSLGGHAALERITSMSFTGNLSLPALKTSGKTSEYFKYPNHFSFVAEIPGYGTARTVYDGKRAWSLDPRRGVSEITGPQLSDISRRSDIHWNLKLKKFYPGLKIVGREKVNDQDAWVLESAVDGWTYRFYFDVGTGLLVRFDTNTHGPDGKSTVLIGDYRRVGNVRFSFAATMVNSKGGWSRQLSTVQFNTPIDDSVFAKPATEPAGPAQSDGGTSRSN